MLRNHTVHTCDGEQLLIVCPRRTTISILGAFYGRRVPSPNLCPSPGNASQESTECMSTTAHLVRAQGTGLPTPPSPGRWAACSGSVVQAAQPHHDPLAFTLRVLFPERFWEIRVDETFCSGSQGGTALQRSLAGGTAAS